MRMVRVAEAPGAERMASYATWPSVPKTAARLTLVETTESRCSGAKAPRPRAVICCGHARLRCRHASGPLAML